MQRDDHKKIPKINSIIQQPAADEGKTISIEIDWPPKWAMMETRRLATYQFTESEALLAFDIIQDKQNLSDVSKRYPGALLDAKPGIGTFLADCDIYLTHYRDNKLSDMLTDSQKKQFMDLKAFFQKQEQERQKQKSQKQEQQRQQLEQEKQKIENEYKQNLLSKENEGLRKQVGELQNQVRELQNKVEESGEEETQTFKEKDKLIDSLRTDIMSLRTDYEDNVELRKNAERITCDLANYLEIASNLNEELQKTIVELDINKRQAYNEINKLRDSLEVVFKEKDDLQKTIKELKKKNEKLQLQNNKLASSDVRTVDDEVAAPRGAFFGRK